MNVNGYYDPGLYCRLHSSCSRSWVPQRAVFLDRDGVLVEDPGYLHRVEDIQAIAGAFRTVTLFNRQGWRVIVVTNQSGIGRGYYGWPQFVNVQDAIEANLASYGGYFDAVLACAYHDDGEGPLRIGNHSHRKPNPGMLIWAAELLNISLSESCLVGDSITDIQAAANAKLGCAIHVRTGHGNRWREAIERFAAMDAPPDFEVFYCDALADSVCRLTQWRNPVNKTSEAAMRQMK